MKTTQDTISRAFAEEIGLIKKDYKLEQEMFTFPVDEIKEAVTKSLTVRNKYDTKVNYLIDTIFSYIYLVKNKIIKFER